GLWCRVTARSTLTQEDVVRRIRHAAEGAGCVAGAVELPAPCIDPLYGGDAAENAAAAPGNHFKLQPGNIVLRRARCVAGSLPDYGAAVAVFPVRSGIVTADGFAVDQQCRDRLAER